MAGHGSGNSFTSAYNTVKRERDSALRNLEYWKKRAHEKMDKAHTDGFWAGVIVACGVWCFAAVFLAVMFW